MFRSTRLCLIHSLCAFMLLVSAGSADAQVRCFQNVAGVPGAYSEAPTWWLGGAPLGSFTNRWIDDPRWQGASSFSHVEDYARFRVLVETVGAQRFLVMMFHVPADPSGPGDRLYVGFWDDTSARGNAIRISRSQSTATGVGGETYSGGAFAARFYNKVGASPWVLNNTASSTPPPLPTWLTDAGNTKVDVFGVAADEWAIRLRIPIVPGADVTLDNPPGINLTAGGTYRFFYQLQDASSTHAITYGFPEGLTEAETDGVSSPTCNTIPFNCLPDPTTTWAQVQDGATCVGDVSIDPSGIFIGSAGNHTVSLTTPNALHARPVNNTVSAQPGDAVKATIRLANWGSTLFASPSWQEICSDVVGTAGSIAAGAQFDITCNWSVPDSCPYKPAGDPCGATAGTRHVDQCMLVDLASAPGSGPYFFSPQSAWQNMMFNGASKMVKQARIDIAGLPALAGGTPNRDLYVYVRTRNMPAQLSPDTTVNFDAIDPKVLRRLGDVQLPSKGAIGKKTAQQLQDAIAQGRISYRDVEALMPTYTAYVWHDTGKVVSKSGGGTLKLLEPQTAFGYFVWHDGGIEGWRSKFEGMNVTEISPNYYKLSVPEGGSIDVTTTIEAVEPGDSKAETTTEPKPPLPPGTPWWVWVLICLVVVLMLFFLVRRPRP